MQRALRLRSGLIEDGLFARTRNPNYLGETLIYISFAILSWHWLPFLVLGGWLCFFTANMRRKDRSLARYPGFAAYKARTGMFLPSIARSSRHLMTGSREIALAGTAREKES